jgi:hypothetical protein
MRSTTSASPHELPDTTSTRNDRKGAQYVAKQGDRWRSDGSRAVSDRP